MPAHLRARLTSVTPHTPLLATSTAIVLAAVALSNCHNSLADSSDGNTPWITQDFESYQTTQEWREECQRRGAQCLNSDSQYLDGSVAYTEAGLSKSIRFEWINQGCSVKSIGFPVEIAPSQTEIWAEVAVRFEGMVWGEAPGCDMPSHKFIFGQVAPDLNGRWELLIGPAGDAAFTIGPPGGSPDNWERDEPVRGDPPTVIRRSPRDLNNSGRWHVIGLHFKHSSAQGVFDAEIELWVDGEYIGRFEREFWTNAGTSIVALLIGRNKDNGAVSGTERMWVGRAQIWKQNPGW